MAEVAEEAEVAEVAEVEQQALNCRPHSVAGEIAPGTRTRCCLS